MDDFKQKITSFSNSTALQNLGVIVSGCIKLLTDKYLDHRELLDSQDAKMQNCTLPGS